MSCLPAWASATRNRPWCCSAAASNRPAGWPVRRLARSIAAATATSTSTWPFTAIWSASCKPGEFARAYVLAHEVGHHVQRLLGYPDMVGQARGFGGQRQQKQGSVRLELQADYLAGVWANHAQQKFNFLDPGDLESALNAAFQIGDDRLQKESQGYVVPDAFTHGTSEQRKRWFTRGFKTGDVDDARLLIETDYDQL